MQALNKKLSVISRKLRGLKIPDMVAITFSVLIAASANLYGGLLELFAAFAALVVFTASVLIFKSLGKITAIPIVLVVIGVHSVSGLYAVLFAILFIVVFRIIKEYVGGEQAFFALAFLSHMGDAVTSYTGFLRGYSEANPFTDFFVQEVGYASIFGVKLMVIPLTFYIYLKTEGKEREFYMKLIYCIGLYLTLRNTIIVF